MSGVEGLRSKSELFQRVVSAVVMAVAGLATAYWGGWIFAVVWAVLAAAILYEWEKIVLIEPAAVPLLPVAAAALYFAIVWAFASRGLSAHLAVRWAVPVLAILAVVGFFAVRRKSSPVWLCGGLVYATLLLAGILVLRGASLTGFFAILFLFIVVWLTDIGAYFSGRTFGGPKFAPRISPKKTWSGVVGGVICGVLCGMLVIWFASHYVEIRPRPVHALIAFVLAIATVYGDLFESFLKRKFGVKDAGSLIPGHGGFLDRLDGFTAAVVLAAALGIARGGIEGAAAGLLTWG